MLFNYRMQNTMEKKWDLSYIYDMTQQALEAGDIDQALKLSKKGIEESESNGDVLWISKFKELSQILMKLQSSSAPIEKDQNKGNKLYEDLTKIKGVGPSHERKLWDAGYNTIEKIANTNPKTLARIKGIGIETAKKFINSAREHLGTSNVISDLDEDFKKKQTSLSLEPTSKVHIKEESEQKSPPWFEDKFKTNRLTHSVSRQSQSESKATKTVVEEKNEFSYQAFLEEKELLDNEGNKIEKNDEENQEATLVEEDVELDYKKETVFKIPKKKQFKEIAKQILQKPEIFDSNIPIQKESVNKSVANYIAEIIKKLALQGYFTIPLSEFKDQFQEIDVLCFKLDSLKQTQQMLLISPIKFVSIHDSLVISEDSIQYQTQKKHNLMINAYKSNLADVQQLIMQDIATKGALLEYIQNFLMTTMDVSNKSYKNNEISLYSSGTHYVVHVDPILLSPSEVKFLEKSIPFAYQKSSNVHYIQENQLEAFLLFLEKKHKFIEEYDTAQRVEDTQEQVNQKFQKQILQYSLIPCVFGGLTIIMALAQIPSLLLPFIGLSYMVLSVYGVIIGYLFYNFKIKRKNLVGQYMVPRYQKPIRLDEASLEIIYQDFNDDLMLQFGYECFGKNFEYKLLHKIEQQKSEQIIATPILNTQEKTLEDLFEQEEDTYHSKIDEYLAE